MAERPVHAFTHVFLPLRALVRRELLTTLRLRRTYALMALIILFLIFVGWAQYPDARLGLTHMAEQARVMFAFITISLYVSALLFVPGLSAAAISVERERDTYDLTRLTLLSPWSLVLGKLMNALGVYVLFVVAAVPILGFVFFMVGVDRYALTAACGITLSTGYACAAAGILCSVALRSTVRALTASYIAMVFLMGLHVGIAEFGAGILSRSLLEQWTWIVAMVPLAILVSTMAGLLAQQSYVYGSCLYLLAAGTLLLTIAGYKLARDHRLDLNPVVQTHARGWFGRRRTHVAGEDQDGNGHVGQFLPHLGIPDTINPILWSEVRRHYAKPYQGLLRRTLLYAALFSIPVLITIAFIISENGAVADLPEMAQGWFFGVGAIIGLIVTAFGASIFTGDRDRGNADFIRGTLLSPLQITLGKFGAGCVQSLPLLAGAFIAGLPLLLLSIGDVEILMLMGQGYIVWIMAALVALAGAMMASAWSQRTTTALAAALAINGGVFFGATILAVISIVTVFRNLQEEIVLAVIVSPSPLLAYFPGELILDDVTYAWNPWPKLSAIILFRGAAGLLQLSLATVFLVIAYQGYRRSHQSD